MVFTSVNRSQSSIESEERYPALQIVLLIWKVLIVLLAIGTVVSAVIVWRLPVPNSLPYSLMTLLAGALICLFQWASVELIQVVLDIEENTRRIADRGSS